MNHSLITKNIHRLLKEKDWKISDLENKLGSNRSVSNILRGSSKNPTIELLQSIAKAFNVEIQDLLDEPIYAKGTNTALLLDTCRKVILQIDDLSLSQQISHKTIIAIIKEVYEYSIHLDLQNIEENFIKWTIHKHTNL